MAATTVEEELLYHTAKAGDIVRQLGLALLAAVWLFNGGTDQAPVIPSSLKCAVILAILSMGLDALQYIVGSIIWGVKTMCGKAGKEAAKQKLTVGLLLAIVVVKIAAMLVAYCYLLVALAVKVKWSA
jgi:hypothetical protein